jgi:hypothetical protein
MKKASTSITVPPDLKTALSALGEPFVTRIVNSYLSVKAAYADGAWDAAGLRIGIFCEALLRYLQQALTGSHTPFGQRLPTFADECVRLSSVPVAAGPESLRQIVPKALTFLYTLRNKRGIGHSGGDVEANEIDVATAVRVADWCVCELIRLKHSLSLEEAQGIVDSIAVRQIPEVWAVLGRKRVLDPSLDYKSQVLLLLHGSDPSGMLVEDLRTWVEYGRPAEFMNRVIRPLHDSRLIEYDEETGAVVLSPRGAERVEQEIVPRVKR